MNIREANKKIKELENDYEFYLREKENLLSLVLPKSAGIKSDVVEGGTRINKLERYVEIEEEKQISKEQTNRIIRRLEERKEIVKAI